MYDLKVGFSCNNNCIHCVVGSKRKTKDLTFQEITEIIDRVPVNEPLQLTGGEISIRKDFFDILKYSHDHGHMNFVQTNGTGFEDEDLVKRCVPYLDHVLLAIHSSSETIHNQIVNCKSTRSMFQRTMMGFKNLIKYGIPVTTQTVLSNLNIPTLYDTYLMIQSIAPGVEMHMTYPHPLGNALLNKDIVCPKYSSIKKYLTPCFRDFGRFIVVEAIPPCYIFPYYENIDALIDSEIKKDKTSRKGYDKANMGSELFPNGETENYNYNDLLSKRKGPLCAQCFYNKECFGVWEEYMKFYSQELDLFPIERLDDRALDDVKLYITGDLNPENLNSEEKNPFADADVHRVILKGDLLNNKDFLLEESKRHPFLLFNAEDLKDFSKKDREKIDKIYVDLYQEKQLDFLKNFFMQETHKWYIDIDITHFSSENLSLIFSFLEQKNDFKTVRLFWGFYNEETFSHQHNTIKEISLDYDFPITLVNIPFCVSKKRNQSNVIFTKSQELRNGKIYSPKEKILEVAQVLEKCKLCKKRTACLGIANELIPLKEN